MYLKILIAALTVISSGLAAEPPSKPRLNARDIYISCYLNVRGVDVPKEERDFNANAYYCAALSTKAIVFQEGIGRKDAIPELIFCLPKQPEVRDNPGRAMAYAYLDFFEKSKPALSELDGELALLMAFANKWPCPK